MNINPLLFSAPVTPEERAEFMRHFYPAHKQYSKGLIITFVMALIAVGMVLYGLTSIFAFALASEAYGTDVASEPHVGQTMLMLGIPLALFLLIHLDSYLKENKSFKRPLDVSIKTSRFAKANNFTYTSKIPSPARSGFIFQNKNATDRKIFDLVSGKNGIPFELGKYYYEVRSDRRTIKRTYTYMRMTLNINLPHMVLDTTADDTNIFGIEISNLGMAFSKDQAMRLEGNFNDYFTLYAPKGYETDALYVFTPDLMALMIDEVSPFNAEIVDDSLYIYSSKNLPFDKSETYQRFFSVYENVGSKALKQTGNYRDSRSEIKGEVATHGRRLTKRTTAVLSGVALLIYAVYSLPVIVQTVQKLLDRFF
jgi:hypothetical protein